MESGRFGLGPLTAKSGDLVHGHEFPIISVGGTLLSYIGVCFVIGLMRGEAAKVVESGERNIKTMEIV